MISNCDNVRKFFEFLEFKEVLLGTFDQNAKFFAKHEK